jgi:hypothetical protein
LFSKFKEHEALFDDELEMHEGKWLFADSPDLGPDDYFLFRWLKYYWGTYFWGDECTYKNKRNFYRYQTSSASLHQMIITHIVEIFLISDDVLRTLAKIISNIYVYLAEEAKGYAK